MMTTSTAFVPVAMCGFRRLVVVRSRIIGLLAAILALVLLPGCSAVKLAYNNAPEAAYWWLDSYADLNEAQSLKVRAELAKLQQWHRATELPRITELLRKTRQLALADTTPDQVCSLWADARKRMDAISDQALAPTAEVASSLTAAQIAHIEAKFAKGNTEWREKWIAGTQAERRARRLESSVERNEQFYGTLDERQLGILRTAIAQSSFNPELSLAERQRRQRDLLQTLRQVAGAQGPERPGAAQVAALLRALLERSVNSPNPAYRVYAERAVQDGCRTVALLHNSTSLEQRERAARRLEAYERDARELGLQP